MKRTVCCVVALFLSTAFLAWPSVVLAEEAGTTIFPFLKIGLGARSPALGGSGVALHGGEVAAHWNPSATAYLRDWSVSAQHHEWLDDLQMEYVGFGRPVWGDCAFALSFAYLHMDAIETRDNLGNLTGGTFKPYDMLLNANFSRSLNQRLAVGLNGKYVQEVIEGTRAGAFAFDVGALYELLPGTVDIGVALQNWGPKAGFMAKDFHLPLTVRGGLCYKPLPELNLIADAVKGRDNDLYAAIGMEYTVMNVLPVRVGYSFNDDLENGFTAGLGFRWEDFVIDYAFAPYEDLGNSHRFMISWQPGNRPPSMPYGPAQARPAAVPAYAPAAVTPAPPVDRTPAYGAAPPRTASAMSPIPSAARPAPAPEPYRAAIPSPPSATADVDKLLREAGEFLDRGRLRDAEDRYLQILRVAPSNPVALTNVADVYYRLGDQQRAQYYVNRVVEMAQQSP